MQYNQILSRWGSFSVPSLNEMKFYKHSFPSFCYFLRGFVNQLPNRRWTHLLCWRQTLLAMETNALCTGDKHFSARDERVVNVHSNFSNTHAAGYQWLPNRPYVQIIATHKYSPPKTNGFMLSYSHLSTLHPQVIQTYGILCMTKRSSSSLRR